MTRKEAASIRPGDEILVRMTVKVSADYDGDLFLETSNGIDGYVCPEDIHSIAPPKPLVVGDNTDCGVILAIDGDSAWVRHSNRGPLTLRLNTLTLHQA